MKAKNLIVIFGILIIIMAGCSKEKTSKIATQPILKTLPCANTNNPYDSVGYLHNEMVTYLTKHVTSTTIDDSLLYYSSLYLYSLRDPRNFDSLIISTPTLYKWYTTSSRTSDFNTFLGAITKEFGTSTLVKNYLDSIYQKLYLAPNEVIDGVITVETEILSNNSLSQSDKHTLLIVAAVARYSYYYWGSSKKSTESSILLGDLMGAYYGAQYTWWAGWWGVVGFAAAGSVLAAM